MNRSSILCPLICFGLGFLSLSCQTKERNAAVPSSALQAVQPVALAGYDSSMQSTHAKAGRYEGWFVTATERFPVAIDLLDSATPGVYEAILSLAWGPSETIGFHLKSVKDMGNSLRVDHEFLHLNELVVSGNQMTGQIFTRFEAQRGQLFLARREGRQQAQPFLPPDVLSRPVGTQVAGSYNGKCGEVEAVLQIETFPWRRVSADSKDWFDHVQVRGRIAKPDDLMCEAGSVCIQRNFTAARFLALDGKIELQGRGGALACTKTGGDLDCGECRFSKDSAEVVTKSRPLPENKILLDRSGKDLLPQTAVDTSGQYFGYLHHEARDVYQLVSLSVQAGMDDGVLGGQAVLTSYLGEGDSTEFSVYRFDDFTVPQAGLMSLDGGSDPLLRIAHWRNGIVRGYWFSKTHGRIGEFHLVRDGVPQLPAGLQLERPLSATYQGKDAEFAILVSPEIADETSALFPLRVFGNAVESREETHRRRIEEIRYDVFLGRVGLVFDDGRLVTGVRTTAGFDLLWPPGPRFGRKVTVWEPKVFLENLDVGPQARR